MNYWWIYKQIVWLFYGSTSLQGGTPNSTIGVELTALTGKSLIATGPGLTINGAPVGAGAIQIARTPSGTFQVYMAASCGGPTWVPWGVRASGLSIGSSGDPTNLNNLIRVGQATTTRGYRGALVMVASGTTTHYVVNRLPIEDYLRGVVPRESPASWGDLGAGRGMNALRAQAVAARA